LKAEVENLHKSLQEYENYKHENRQLRLKSQELEEQFVKKENEVQALRESLENEKKEKDISFKIPDDIDVDENKVHSFLSVIF